MEEESAPTMNYPIDENLFYSAPSQPLPATTASITADLEDTAHEEPAANDFPHPLDFKPLFTLIEDPETGEHHHPTVHYIFSDDDEDILTRSALEVLNKDNDAPEEATNLDHVEERYVIVDMAPDGKSVTSVSSTSTNWLATKTSITQAPSWGDDAKDTNRGLMLKISGQESASPSNTKDSTIRQQQSDNLDDLVKQFSDQLASLDEVVGKADVERTEYGDTR